MRRGDGWPSAEANASPSLGGSDRVVGAPQHQRRALVAAQRFEHPPALRRTGGVGGLRDQAGEGARSGLRGDARERRVVGRGDLVAGVAVAAAADQEADREVLGALDEGGERLPVVVHRRRAVEHAAVEDHEARDALGVLDGQAQPDRAAPVVDDEGGVADVEVLEQRRRRRHVAVVGVPPALHRLVGAAEADEVGEDDAMAGVPHRGQDVAPQVAPGGLAVPHHHRRAVSLVDVGEAQPVDGAVARLVGEVRQPLEDLVGGADRVGGHPEGSTRSSSGSRAFPSGAAVTWIAPGSRTQAITSSVCRRSSTNWKASACGSER